MHVKITFQIAESPTLKVFKGNVQFYLFLKHFTLTD